MQYWLTHVDLQGSDERHQRLAQMGVWDLPKSSCCVLWFVSLRTKMFESPCCSRKGKERPRSLPLPSLAMACRPNFFIRISTYLSCPQVAIYLSHSFPVFPWSWSLLAIAARPKLIQERRDRVSRPWHDEGEMDCGMWCVDPFLCVFRIIEYH